MRNLKINVVFLEIIKCLVFVTSLDLIIVIALLLDTLNKENGPALASKSIADFVIESKRTITFNGGKIKNNLL